MTGEQGPVAGRPPGEELLERLRREHGIDERLRPYRAQRWSGRLGRHPALCVDDFSEIPFLSEVTGVPEYQHRARLRAREGDLYLASTPPADGYEAYNRRLGLGTVDILRQAPERGDVELLRACLDEPLFGRLVDRGREAGGLVIHPFMGIAAAWELAERVARESAVPVEVLGPPPPATWIANDKLAFDRLVETVLGREWLVETRHGADVATITEALLSLCTRHAQVGLKRLRCASAMGNQVLDASRVLAADPGEVRAQVAAFLERTEWDGHEDVLVVAWEKATSSPSTQLWIPASGQGEPRVDGVYEQILAGDQGVFVGSRPSRLPPEINRRLGEAARTVGFALQALGYVGRCSFDHLVLGDPAAEARIVFTECNGRWGGTSTPMHLLDRLAGAVRPPYRAQDVVAEQLVGMPFLEVLARTGEEVFDPPSGRGRFLFYNVGPLAEHGKLDVIAVGATQDEAEEAMEVTLPRLLGL